MQAEPVQQYKWQLSLTGQQEMPGSCRVAGQGFRLIFTCAEGMAAESRGAAEADRAYAAGGRAPPTTAPASRMPFPTVFICAAPW